MARTRSTQGVAAGVVVLLLIVAAAWVTTRDRSDRIVSSLLYPDLAERVQSAERVQLLTAGDRLAVEVVRSGEDWTVVQRDGYPADIGKIGVLLQNVAELKVLEPKTADPASYAALGVEDVTDTDAQGIRLVVTAPGDTRLVDLIIGKGASGMAATYVRKAGESSSWLVNRLELSRSPGAWISSLVMHIDTDRIHQARVRSGDNAEFVLTKANRNARDFVAEGKPLAKPSAANGIAAALIAVEAQDVRRPATVTARAPAAQATYRMFDGLELELTGWTADNQRWVTVVPSFNAALAARFANDKPEGNAANAFWRTPDQAKQEAERLAGKLSGWAFRVPDYKYDGIFPDVEQWR